MVGTGISLEEAAPRFICGVLEKQKFLVIKYMLDVIDVLSATVNPPEDL